MLAPDAIIRDAALALPEELRAELVGSLLRSLPEPAPTPAPYAPPTAANHDDAGVTWEGVQSFLDN